MIRNNIHHVFIWEHEWERIVFKYDNNKEINLEYNVEIADIYWERKKFHEKMFYNPKHCEIRSALHGGRVNNLKFYHRVSGDEKICYYDFTSLYPFVLSKRDFPVGHPVIIHPSEPAYMH